jgi:hypothetical protein
MVKKQEVIKKKLNSSKNLIEKLFKKKISIQKIKRLAKYKKKTGNIHRKEKKSRCFIEYIKEFIDIIFKNIFFKKN